ncbi:MAG: ComEC/Rec2 family competence protein, partial [Candidatus Aminicenantaceae bacterium]
MAFPFLYLLLSLSAGIFFFSKILHLPGIFLVIIFIISLLSSWLFYCLERLKISYFLILLSVFFLGAFLQISSDKNFQNNALHNLDYSSYADIYGTLYKSPRKSHNKVYLYMKVHKINYQKKEITAKGNLRITVFNPSPENDNLDLFINDRIKASAQFVSHKGFFNFGQSSLDLYLKTNKIHKRAFTKSPLLIEKLKKAKTLNLLNSISRIRSKIQKRIEQYFPSPAENTLSPEGAVLEALMLGERQRLDPEFSRSLQQTGLYHLLAISGAHIAIISLFLFSLFKMLRMSNSLSYTLIIAFLMFNAFLVEGRPSVIRATIMAVAFLIGKLIFSDVNLLNTISISAFFLLVINPFFLFNSGFLLTFTATFSIILFFPKIRKYLPKLKFRISEIFGISLCAQLGVIPIIIIFFNRAAFSSIVYNYIALPLVALIMASGYIFLPISLTIPFLARISSKIIYFLINLLIKFTSLSANAPLSLRVPNPHLMVIIGYYVFLLLFLFPTKIKKQKLILFLCFLVMSTFLILHPFPNKSKNLKVTMIDVGQGDSILIELPGREKMLIDGGGVPNDNFDIGEFAVSKFLWKKRIKKIDYLILSHAHPDHINGLKSIARNFKIGEFWEAYT